MSGRMSYHVIIFWVAAVIGILVLLAANRSLEHAAGPSGALAAVSSTVPPLPGERQIVLTTVREGDRRYFQGVGGGSDKVRNPTLILRRNEPVRIRLVCGDEELVDIVLPGFQVSSPRVAGPGHEVSVTLHPLEVGASSYYCSVPTMRERGMEGAVQVVEVGDLPGHAPIPVAARPPGS